MNPSKYQTAAARTECDQEMSRARMAGACDSRGLPCGTDHLAPIRLNHAVLGLTGEVGELASAVERWIYYGRQLDVANVKEEIGDCLWYLALACNSIGLSLEQVMEANIAKLKARYPEKYSDERAAVRDLEAEKEAMSSQPNRVIQDGHGFGHVEDK